VAKKGTEYPQTLIINAYADAQAAAAGAIVKAATSYGAAERMGMVIQHIHYTVNPTGAGPQFLGEGLLDTVGDQLLFGLSYIGGMPEVWGFSSDDEGLVDWNMIERVDVSLAPVNFLLFEGVHRDFSTWVGGGKLVHPTALYFWMGFPYIAGIDLSMTARIEYFMKPLSDADYMQLWEARIVTQAI
jgi:hypothetical protein